MTAFPPDRLPWAVEYINMSHDSWASCDDELLPSELNRRATYLPNTNVRIPGRNLKVCNIFSNLV